jgi:hypothetical protein
LPTRFIISFLKGEKPGTPANGYDGIIMPTYVSLWGSVIIGIIAGILSFCKSINLL